MKQDGKPTTFSSKADSASGAVTVSVARSAGSGGVSGSGTLVTFQFRAANQGPASLDSEMWDLPALMVNRSQCCHLAPP